MARPFSLHRERTVLASPRSRRFVDLSTVLLAALVGAGGIVVYSRSGLPGVWDVLVADTGLFLDILPKVLAGCLIGAFVTLILPREIVTRWVGADSGLGGLLVATVIGAIMPGGPFTIYPLGATFLAIGAGVGPVVAFVTAWTLIGFNRSVIWEIPFFGVDFVLTRVLVSLPLPVLAGLLAQVIFNAISGPQQDSGQGKP